MNDKRQLTLAEYKQLIAERKSAQATVQSAQSPKNDSAFTVASPKETTHEINILD